MKNIIYIAVITLIIIVIYAFNNPPTDFKSDPESGIQFHKGTWEEAIALAKKENKLIFLDIYATWCGPCKKLKTYTFSNKKVGEYFNANFINVALDGEKGEGQILADKYKLKGYPSLFFIDTNEKIILESGGYQNAEKFIKLGKSVKK